METLVGIGNGAIRHVAANHGIDTDSAVIANLDAGMDACPHPDHASLPDPHIAGDRGMWQNDGEVIDRNPRAQDIVGEEMHMPAQGDVRYNGEWPNVTPFAEIGVGGGDR